MTDTKPKPRYTVAIWPDAYVLRRLARSGVFDTQIRKLNQLAPAHAIEPVRGKQGEGRAC
ncbi:hypothetical protein ABZT06_38365 [Streptomyces sp. NPDC005483]|uniref:hypothetical protein n=1 Tax=Streptomyces sp. NPDC005483 TaxID=3154882 RepID=UPI0033B7EF9F